MKKKEGVRGRTQFQAYKSILLFWAKCFACLPVRFRDRLLVRFRYTRGKLGLGIRYALVKSMAESCGDNVFIGQGVFLFNVQNLRIGSNVSIHPMCYLFCSREKDGFVQIDDNVSIAHGVTIMAFSHSYENDTTDIIKDMPTVAKPVHICSNVWIGAKATVLLGVTVESGCVIGAQSLVNRSTEKNGVYVGAPAKRIKSRNSSAIQAKEKQE